MSATYAQCGSPVECRSNDVTCGKAYTKVCHNPGCSQWGYYRCDVPDTAPSTKMSCR
jgi:hypothetical protein